VSSADANLAALKAQLEDARSFFVRQEDLAASGVISQRDLDIARTNYQAAEARHEQASAQLEQSLLSEQSAASAGLDQAQAQLQQAQAQISQAEAALHLAQVNLSYTTIRSPIDGVVVSRKVNVGQTVAASLQAPTLFTIANDLRRMQIIASIDQSDIGEIHSSNRISFTVDAFPVQDFTGTIQQIRLDPQNVQNVVTYNVVIDVENPELKLMPGMTANITVTVDERADVLKIPNAALRFIPLDQAPEEFSPKPGDMLGDESSPLNSSLSSLVLSGQSRTVWVLGTDRQPHPREIRTGITDGVATEVLNGDLREGEAVIIMKKPADNN
jgi:HlyD family secretion protein